MTEDNWLSIKSHVFYRPHSFERDGYIHCSFEDQVIKVAETLYRGREDLVILCINENRVQSILKVEDLFNLNEEYPHLYGELPINSIERVVPLNVLPNGDFEKPNLTSISSLEVKQGEWT